MKSYSVDPKAIPKVENAFGASIPPDWPALRVHKQDAGGECVHQFSEHQVAGYAAMQFERPSDVRSHGAQQVAVGLVE
jgi:hypothetical protein